MNNLDYWQTFVGEDTPETFLRNYGTADPELCVARFLEDRNNLYGVVNQGQWRDTFQTPEQHQRLTVQVYLLSYLEETRDEWAPALEAKPPAIPRRYREKFDQDKYPPPPKEETGSADEASDEAQNLTADPELVVQPDLTTEPEPAAVDDTPVIADAGTPDSITNTDIPSGNEAPVEETVREASGDEPGDPQPEADTEDAQP